MSYSPNFQRYHILPKVTSLLWLRTGHKLQATITSLQMISKTGPVVRRDSLDYQGTPWLANTLPGVPPRGDTSGCSVTTRPVSVSTRRGTRPLARGYQGKVGHQHAQLEVRRLSGFFIFKFVQFGSFYFWIRSSYIHSGVNSIKKYKCTLQVGRTIVFTNSYQFESNKSIYKFPLEASNLHLR